MTGKADCKGNGHNNANGNGNGNAAGTANGTANRTAKPNARSISTKHCTIARPQEAGDEGDGKRSTTTKFNSYRSQTLHQVSFAQKATRSQSIAAVKSTRSQCTSSRLKTVTQTSHTFGAPENIRIWRYTTKAHCMDNVGDAKPIPKNKKYAHIKSVVGPAIHSSPKSAARK